MGWIMLGKAGKRGRYVSGLNVLLGPQAVPPFWGLGSGKADTALVARKAEVLTI